MEKEYAIGIDLGGTSVKYALIDNEGVFHFQGKLPSKADVSHSHRYKNGCCRDCMDLGR